MQIPENLRKLRLYPKQLLPKLLLRRCGEGPSRSDIADDFFNDTDQLDLTVRLGHTASSAQPRLTAVSLTGVDLILRGLSPAFHEAFALKRPDYLFSSARILLVISATISSLDAGAISVLQDPLQDPPQECPAWQPFARF